MRSFNKKSSMYDAIPEALISRKVLRHVISIYFYRNKATYHLLGKNNYSSGLTNKDGINNTKHYPSNSKLYIGVKPSQSWVLFLFTIVGAINAQIEV